MGAAAGARTYKRFRISMISTRLAELGCFWARFVALSLREVFLVEHLGLLVKHSFQP